MMETLIIQMWGWCLHWFWKRRLCKLDLFFFLPLTKWNGPKLNIITKFLQIFLHIKRIKWQKGFSSQPSLLYHVCYMGVCSNMKYTVEYSLQDIKFFWYLYKYTYYYFKNKTKNLRKSPQISYLCWESPITYGALERPLLCMRSVMNF